MWFAAVAWRARAVHAGHDPLPRLQRARDRLDDDRLVVAQAQDVDDLRAAVAVLALDRPAVGDLAAARSRRTATPRA